MQTNKLTWYINTSKKVTRLVFIRYSIKTVNHCSNVKTAWRRRLNHNNFDTSFVKIDQVLIILWGLKGEKYPFPLLQYIVLTIPIGSILWWMIWTTYHLMSWFSYVIQFFWFPNVWKWTDDHHYTSYTYLNRPIWIDIIMNPHSCIKHTNMTTSLIYC